MRRGGPLLIPKSFSVSTSPVPKYRIQTRLTVTRGVSGLFCPQRATAREIEPRWLRLAGVSARRGEDQAGVFGIEFPGLFIGAQEVAADMDCRCRAAWLPLRITMIVVKLAGLRVSRSVSRVAICCS